MSGVAALALAVEASPALLVCAPDQVCLGCRTGYERELHVLLTQLVRDMDRKIERQEERARKESEPKPVSATEQLELDALKVLSCRLSCT